MNRFIIAELIPLIYFYHYFFTNKCFKSENSKIIMLHFNNYNFKKAGQQMKRLLFLFISVLLVFSCSSTSTTDNSKNNISSLENTSWKLVDISGEKIPPKPDNQRFGDFTLNIGTD